MPVYFAGMNKTKLRARIQSVVNWDGVCREFESELLSNLIREKHYYCSVHALRPVSFRTLPRAGGGYTFQGRFEGHGWKTVSWDQCITPKREVDFLTDALRLAMRPITKLVVAERPACEVCHAVPSQVCHHETPRFAEIFVSASAAMSDSDWEDIWREFDWWNPDPFAIPEASPLYQRALELHHGAVLMAVCEPCHGALHS